MGKFRTLIRAFSLITIILFISDTGCKKDESSDITITTIPGRLNQSAYKVLYINPRFARKCPNPVFFHDKLMAYPLIAARDIGISVIRLEITFDPKEKIAPSGLSQAIKKYSPDGVVMTGTLSSIPAFSEIIRNEILNKNIPLVCFHSPLRGFGKPGEQYSSYIADILPDDVQAGYLLAKTLIKKALRNGIKHPTLVALPGGMHYPFSQLRLNGLNKALDEFPGVKLHQTISVDKYDTELAKTKTRMFLRDRYPDTNIIWCGSDSIAAGVMDACKELHKNEKCSIIAGGIDWSDYALREVGSNSNAVSVGGHFLDGAWAMVLIYDYLNGINMTDTKTFYTKMEVVERKDHHMINSLLKSRSNDILNFRQFSKAHNKSLDKYNFSVQKILGIKQ